MQRTLWKIFFLNSVLSVGFGGTADQVELTGPAVISLPPPLTYFSNSIGLTLSCVGSSKPGPLTVKWLDSNGYELVSIPGIREQLQNNSLQFKSFKPEEYIATVHGGDYRCSVSNAVGTFLSPVFGVRAILDQPFHVVAKSEGNEWLEGSPALLTCQVSPPFLSPFVRAIAWKEIDQFGHEREIQLSDSRYVMGCDGSLIVLSAKPQQLFVCTAKNSLNKRTVASAPFLLKSQSVRHRPPNGMAPKPVLMKELCENDNGQLSPRGGDEHVPSRNLICLAVANPSPTFRWEKFDKTGGKFVPVMTSDDGSEVATGPLLRVSNSFLGRNETYRCEVSNAFGTFSGNYSISFSSSSSRAAVEPRKLLARSGQTVEFSCKVKMNNSDSLLEAVSWLKNGKPLAAPTGSGGRFKVSFQKLQIFNVVFGDQGVYQCFTKHSTESSAGTLLFPSTPPELVHTFILQSLQPGPPVSLKCSAVGNPPPVISWLIDGKMVADGGTLSSSDGNYKGLWSHSQHSRLSSGERTLSQQHSAETVSHLNISEVRPEDGGVYSCTASNLVSSTTHFARLNVYGAIFVKEMGPVTLVHGQTVQLPCHYGGFPVDKFVWQKDSRSISELEKKGSAQSRFGVLPNGTLQIERVSTDEDKGSYTCIISNRKGEVASGTVHVNVMRPPAISLFKFDDNLTEGQRTSVSCNVISGDLPIDISWRKDGKPIAPHLNVTETKLRFLSMLVFEELRDGHSGEYSCFAANEAATAKFSANLQVKVPPKWKKLPQDSKTVLNSGVILSCSADGVPSPSISWFREVNGMKYPLRGGGKYMVGQSGTLEIGRVEEGDSSVYICEAANGVGNGISKSIRLDVIIPAKVSAEVKSVVVAEGESAMLHCQINGDRPVQVIWKRNSAVMEPTPSQIHDNPLVHGGRVVLQEVSEVNSSGVLSAQLTIRPSVLSDSGLYVCSASNQYGRDEDRINLQVKARPSPPENFVVEEIGSRSVRLRWSTSRFSSGDDAPVTLFILQWKMSLSPLSWDITSGEVFNLTVSSPSNKAVIEGLSPVTNYEIRLLASSDIGQSFPTEPLTVLTLAEAPSAPPANVSAVQVSSTSVLVKWEPPEKQFQHGDITGYQIIAMLQSSMSTSPSNNRSGAVVVDENMEQRCEVKRLRPNSRYKISIRAYNSAGMGPESSPLFIQTPEGAPDSPPINLQCESLSSKSLQIQWDPPPPHLSNGQILGYKVVYLPAQAERVGEKAEVKKTSNRETTLHGLSSYTSYSVKVLAYTAGGESETSQPVTCTTDEDVPDEPADLKALVTSATSALVSWLPPLSPNGVITKYTISWKTEESSSVREKPYIPTIDDQQPSWEIRKLKENQRFSIWVTASTNAGSGRPSKAVVILLSSNTNVPGMIASFPVTQKVIKDQSVGLPCKAVGSPSPKLTWLKDQLPLSSHGLMRNGSLFINRVKDGDEGEYTCRAENEFGSDVIHHRIVISRPPSSVQLFLGYVTDTSVQVHWDPPERSDPPLLKYVLQYQLEKVSQRKEWHSVLMSAQFTSYSLEGLRCGTSYNLKLFAENEVGRGQAGSVVNARTNGSPPGASPRLTDILDGNGTMVRIDLNRWPDGGCPITNFKIEYRKEDGDSSGSREWNHIYRKDNLTRVFIFKTEPGSKYQIRFRVVNDAGPAVKAFFVKSQSDFFRNYAKVLERVEWEEKRNGGSNFVPFYADPHVLVPIVSGVICIFALTVCALLLYKRKKHSKPEWKFNASTSQQSWLSASEKREKNEDAVSSKYGTEESMSIYATLNSTKPIPMTIRDSTVRLHSFRQHDNYDAPTSLVPQQASAQIKKARRKSKSSPPLEEAFMQQVVPCQMEFPTKIEPPREFRSSSSSHQHFYQVHQHQPSANHQYQSVLNSDEEPEYEQHGREQGSHEDYVDEVHQDYSSPYQFIGKETDVQASRPTTLKRKHTPTAGNSRREYFN